MKCRSHIRTKQKGQTRTNVEDISKQNREDKSKQNKDILEQNNLLECSVIPPLFQFIVLIPVLHPANILYFQQIWKSLNLTLNILNRHNSINSNNKLVRKKKRKKKVNK